MKINTATVLKELNNSPVKDEKGEVITLGKIIAMVFTTPRAEGFHDPLKAYILAQKFYDQKEVELDEADLNTVKETLIASKTFNPLHIGQALQLLNKSDKKE